MRSSTEFLKPRAAHEVLERARLAARKEERHKQGGFVFESIADHILDSACRHDADFSQGCSRCVYENVLKLPELPEMLFPKNFLRITFPNSDSFIEFNALDALKMVCNNKLPDVQVGPSAVWQGTRQDHLQTITDHRPPYDWTYTTHYKGTLNRCKAELTTHGIDMDRLRRRDEIAFYSGLTLFEDELADHGIAQLSTRVRVMAAGYFFVLLRLYMRVDGVLFRVCDTRIVGEDGANFVTREWQLREAKFEDVVHVKQEELNDVNLAWQHLPVVAECIEKISPAV